MTLPSDITIEESKMTPRGYHYINSFQCCPRQWYFRHICGLSPQYVKKSLLFGQAIHNTKEIFYRMQGYMKADDLAEIFHTQLECLHKYYQYEEDFAKDLEDGKAMLVGSKNKKGEEFLGWYDRYGRGDMVEFKLIATEPELWFPLYAGDEDGMTVRPDLILQHRETENFVIVETKTTRFSLDGMLGSTLRSDQLLIQQMGFAHEYGIEHFAGVIVDVMYKNGSRVDCQRSAPVVFSHQECEDLKTQLSSEFHDLAQRRLGVGDGTNNTAIQLEFPRNRSACSQFKCDYQDICSLRIHPDTKVPGFVNG